MFLKKQSPGEGLIEMSDLACGALAASCQRHSQSKHHLRKKKI